MAELKEGDVVILYGCGDDTLYDVKFVTEEVAVLLGRGFHIPIILTPDGTVEIEYDKAEDDMYPVRESLISYKKHVTVQ